MTFHPQQAECMCAKKSRVFPFYCHMPNTKENTIAVWSFSWLLWSRRQTNAPLQKQEFGALPGTVTSNTHYLWLHKVQEHYHLMNSWRMCYKTRNDHNLVKVKRVKYGNSFTQEAIVSTEQSPPQVYRNTFSSFAKRAVTGITDGLFKFKTSCLLLIISYKHPSIPFTWQITHLSLKLQFGAQLHAQWASSLPFFSELPSIISSSYSSLHTLWTFSKRLFSPYQFLSLKISSSLLKQGLTALK